MRAKLKAVKTELILLGLAAVFLGALWGVSVRDRAMPGPVHGKGPAAGGDPGGPGGPEHRRSR